MPMKGVLLGVALSTLATNALAQDAQLLCRYERSVDGTGKPSGTSGEFSATITYFTDKDNKARVRIGTDQAPCLEFYGAFDDLRVAGTCERWIENPSGTKTKMSRSLQISRVSGSFEEIVQFNGDKGGLTFYGRCSATKKLF